MDVPSRLAPYWAGFISAFPGVDEGRFYEAFSFGDSEELANELGALVLRGIKRATAGSFWSFAQEGKPLPVPGALSIVTDWVGEPLCVIETQTVEVVRFDEVSAAFAATEGEGDGSLSYWRDAHRRYFTRECDRAGRAFTEGMLVVCERFRVVHPRPTDAT